MPRVSPHDPAVREALAITRFLGHGPRRALLIGVIPASLDLAPELSAPVRASVQAAVALVVEALAKTGVHAEHRRVPCLPSGWWELLNRRSLGSCGADSEDGAS